jgi:hypothetical protein
MPAMPRLSTTRLPILIVVALLVLGIAVPITDSELGFGGNAATSPSPSPSASTAVLSTPTPPASPTASPVPPSPAPSPSASPPTAAIAAVPIVPVTQFRASATSTSSKEVANVLAGRSGRYEAIEVVAAEADAILAALGAARPSGGSRLVTAPDAATVTADLAAHRKRLAFLRAADVTPAVRALDWGGRSLYGVDRVKRIADWRLTAQLPGDPPGAVDPAKTWTLFAGGDILLDRGVYQTLRIRGKGADFPFDGGRAEITGHTCCSGFGWPVPVTRRTGGAGAMRHLISSADIAVANFENPAPDQSTYHTSGTRFTADPRLIPGLVHAGIDYVSIANNHIGDAGDLGILQTIANLKKNGLKYSGAGKDLAAARKPAILKAGGTTIAILGYDAIAKGYFAGPDETGSSQLSLKRATTDIQRARAAGADLVIVFPHWGIEYRNKPFEAQQQLARSIIDAGADMIIGNHAHWIGAVEIYKGKPIWYALGNFVFDQTWSEPTMEGLTLELTFQGAELRQIRMRPHVILDKAQPNFLDLAGDGKVVLGGMYDASRGLLPY